MGYVEALGTVRAWKAQLAKSSHPPLWLKQKGEGEGEGLAKSLPTPKSRASAGKSPLRRRTSSALHGLSTEEFTRQSLGL